jgi:hypothetical protein
MASAIILPISGSPFAEMVPTCAISSLDEIAWLTSFSSTGPQGAPALFKTDQGRRSGRDSGQVLIVNEGMMGELSAIQKRFATVPDK